MCVSTIIHSAHLDVKCRSANQECILGSQLHRLSNSTSDANVCTCEHVYNSITQIRANAPTPSQPKRLSTTFQLEEGRQQTALHNFLQLLHPAVLTLLLPHNFLNCTKLLCWMQQCCPSVRPPAVLGAAGAFYICTQPLSNGSLPLITCQTVHLNQPLNVCSRKPPPEMSKAFA